MSEDLRSEAKLAGLKGVGTDEVLFDLREKRERDLFDDVSEFGDVGDVGVLGGFGDLSGLIFPFPPRPVTTYMPG